MVELLGNYEGIVTTDKKYDSKTSGKVVSVNAKGNEFLVGKRIFWRQYNEGEVINDQYAFVKIEDIDGYADA